MHGMKTKSDVIINEFSQIDTSAWFKLYKSQVMVNLEEFI